MSDIPVSKEILLGFMETGHVRLTLQTEGKPYVGLFTIAPELSHSTPAYFAINLLENFPLMVVFDWYRQEWRRINVTKILQWEVVLDSTLEFGDGRSNILGQPYLTSCNL